VGVDVDRNEDVTAKDEGPLKSTEDGPDTNLQWRWIFDKYGRGHENETQEFPWVEHN
jgi:hypothetical protein